MYVGLDIDKGMVMLANVSYFQRANM